MNLFIVSLKVYCWKLSKISPTYFRSVMPRGKLFDNLWWRSGEYFDIYVTVNALRQIVRHSCYTN